MDFAARFRLSNLIKDNFNNMAKSMWMEKEFVEVATCMPKAEFLRICDMGGSADDIDCVLEHKLRPGFSDVA